MRWLGAATLLLLSACATAPPAAAPAWRGQDGFEITARFSLRLESPPQNASGRLAWRHTARGEHLFISDPFGQGIAEITLNDAGAELSTGKGIRRSSDAAGLLREATGYELPLAELPAWLLGRPGPGGRMESDDAGRPRRLFNAGWRIDYTYDTADAKLPARLTALRDNELELRLRIEEWRPLPND